VQQIEGSRATKERIARLRSTSVITMTDERKTQLYPQPVILNQHDWLDGGTGENGFPMAPSWSAFLEGWATVYFQFPRHMMWSDTLIPGVGCDWAGPEFREPRRGQRG